MSQGAGKLRVGIVSANWGAKAHLPAWRALGDDVEVTAICTSRQESAEAAAKEFGIARPFWDFEAMCADPDIDIVDAGTSPLLREKIVAAALNGGKHAFNQSPFATSVEAAERLVALQRAKGLTGGVAASMVGLPQLALMKEMIDEGYIGEVFQVHCAWQMSYFLPSIPQFPYNWFGKAGYGVSVTRNHGSHMLQALLHVFGGVDSVVARMETQLKTWELGEGETMQVETDDTCHALLSFANGAMGTLTTSWTAADSPGFSLEVFGSKGRLHLQDLRFPGAASARLYAAKASHGMAPSGQEVPVPDRFFNIRGRQIPRIGDDPEAGAQMPSMARLFDGFTRAIREGGEPPAGFARALEVERILAAMHQSHERKAWVAPAAG